jgi:hypothetical protein
VHRLRRSDGFVQVRQRDVLGQIAHQMHGCMRHAKLTHRFQPMLPLEHIAIRIHDRPRDMSPRPPHLLNQGFHARLLRRIG